MAQNKKNSQDSTDGRMSRTNIEREDRSMNADSRTDRSAGSEGVEEMVNEDMAMETGNREALEDSMMASTDERAGSSMRESSRQHTERGTSNNRQQGREAEDNNARGFSGQGNQREGAENPEGTGYTSDSDKLKDESDR